MKRQGVLRPIRTFGDLEKHLRTLKGPLNLDFEALARVRRRKQKANSDILPPIEHVAQVWDELDQADFSHLDKR